MPAANLNTIRATIEARLATELAEDPAIPPIGKRIRDLYNRVNVSGVFFDAPIGPEALASPAPEGYFQTQVRVTFESIEEL